MLLLLNDLDLSYQRVDTMSLPPNRSSVQFFQNNLVCRLRAIFEDWGWGFMVKLELFCDAVDLHLIIFTNACRPPSVLMQFKPLVIRGNPSMELKNPFVLFSCHFYCVTESLHTCCSSERCNTSWAQTPSTLLVERFFWFKAATAPQDC